MDQMSPYVYFSWGKMIDKAYSIIMVLFLFFAVLVFIHLVKQTNEMSMSLLEEESRKDMIESKQKHIDTH
jgi:hypothetical protein